jgi:prepilin-type processing-associated H-X9-DG protein
MMRHRSMSRRAACDARGSMPGRRNGGVLLRALAVAAVFSIILSGLYAYLGRMRRTVQCAGHLTRIYYALEMYELAEDTLPTFAFFPDTQSNRTGGDATGILSLRELMETYDVEADLCICPSAPRALADLGLTYVWNTSLNGKPLPEPEQRQWMLVEMQAILPELPAPHLGRFNVLYTDGTVERVRSPHEKLEGL